MRPTVQHRCLRGPGQVTITANDLQNILAGHVKWLAGDPEGRRADLRRADLRRADLLPDFQIPQEGSLIVWKAVQNGIAKIEVPAAAKRTACLINRKCRAEFVRVLEIIVDGESAESASGMRDASVVYHVGEVTRPDSYDDNPAVDCAHGIHFFLTRKEAEDWKCPSTSSARRPSGLPSL